MMKARCLGRLGDFGAGDRIMVRKAQLSIAGLMVVVLAASVGLTALRLGTAPWAGATTLATMGALGLGVVGTVCRRGAERSWWLGFSIFGWGYMFLIFMGPYSGLLRLPTSAVLEILRPTGPRNGLFFIGPSIFDAYSQTGHSLFGLAAGALGGGLAVLLFGSRSEGVADPLVKARSPWKRWPRSAVFGAMAIVVGVVMSLAGLRWAPGPSCSATMYATWGLLGLTAIRAVCRQGRSRAVCLGAALFGIGYMALNFNHHPDRPAWPRVGTDLLLRALRPSWYISETPPYTSNAAFTNAWIRQVLERPIPMRYRAETPLEDILKAIQAASRDSNDRTLSIYVNPIGLQEAEKTMASPISIDLEGVPLRTTLYLMLNQLDLGYQIQDGMIYISSHRGDDVRPFDDVLPFTVGLDPYLSVGHCLLALLAAGLGAMLARWFCAPREEPAAQPMSI
jgi:hypothetical protein